jgi:hypothetical protein
MVAAGTLQGNSLPWLMRVAGGAMRASAQWCAESPCCLKRKEDTYNRKHKFRSYPKPRRMCRNATRRFGVIQPARTGPGTASHFRQRSTFVGAGKHSIRFASFKTESIEHSSQLTVEPVADADAEARKVMSGAVFRA